MAPGAVMPDPVGSEKSKLTFGLRRTFNAFCGRPIFVAIRKRPSLSNNGLTGQVCGEPLLNVVNSHVRYSRIIRTTSAHIGGRWCGATHRTEPVLLGERAG